MTPDERNDAWASLRMIADAIGELFGPRASIESEDASLLRGPEYHHFAQGIVDALQRVAQTEQSPNQAALVVPNAKQPNETWRCAGCGKAADGLIKTCDCQTMVGCRKAEDGRRESIWLVTGAVGSLSECQIKHMVSRFLMWRLPENFRPDHGISYTNPYPLIPTLPGPMGTNLFDAVQAEAMVRHMIDGLPSKALPNPSPVPSPLHTE